MHAEWVWGLLLTRKALRAASGNLDRKRPKVVAGTSQHRNVWMSAPTRPYTNDQWVTYAFKNSTEFSRVLGESRLAFPHGLRTEAKRLWELMRKGEPALSQWD